MAMEIRVNEGTYRTDYADRLQREREEAAGAENSRNGEKAAKAGSSQNGERVSERKPVQHDEYISSEKAGEKPNGLYHVGQDENGNKKVYFNDPKKAGKEETSDRSEKDGSSKLPEVKSDDPDNAEEKCVGNTDKVDREIRELKEKKQKLEQQIKQASGDEKKTKELENKLAQVERELSQKDNDTYRRQHSTFTDK